MARVLFLAYENSFFSKGVQLLDFCLDFQEENHNRTVESGKTFATFIKSRMRGHFEFP
jgi:hypothetical protein